MKLFYSLICFVLFTPLWGQEIVVVNDSDVGSGITNWTSDKEYHLDGYVIVEESGTLNIEAGTVIKGLNSPTTGDQASALIVARGAQIFAEGTADKPIIFTAEFDDVNDPNDGLTNLDRGLWGGVIILGSGIVGVDGGIQNVEGIPSTEGRAEYGGNNNADNSGVLRYVSIRHGGAKLEANNEINGLTLAGVGSETEIDYIEVYANLDDGIEWFGGAVNVKHAVVAFCGDDSFDYDQSWDGKGQFWFTIQYDDSNRAGEWDGSEAADLEPKVSPVISNCTFIGGGPVSNNEDGNDALRIRDDAAVHFYNSIMLGFTGKAIVLDNDAAEDSWQRFVDGDISFNSNIMYQFGDGASLADLIDTDGGGDAQLLEHLQVRSNSVEDPVLGGVSRNPDNGLDPRISNGSPALGGAELLQDAFFDPVPYRGAFGNSDNWLADWTALDQNGFLGDLVEPADIETVIVRDEDITAGMEVTWTADKQYMLDGYVFVEQGAVLTINPGTVIKGLASPSTGDKSSALIITRGAKIIADGREDAPIIFTAEFDDLENCDDLTPGDKGLWGGLVILGNGIVGVDGGVQNVEGIPSIEGRAEYGGDNNADDSGILRYVSIRHGGDKLEANNEINGLTLGGVGSTTVIDYIEIYANLDDGIEWFGGAVNVKHASVAFCGDDSYDYDQSWDGKGQFWFSIQDENSNRAGEWDGSEASNFEPKASPVFSNFTFIGAGEVSFNEDGNDALRIRDDAAAHVYNSIFTGFADQAIIIDNDAAEDSYQRFLDGDLTFVNNIFDNFQGGQDLDNVFDVDGGDSGLFLSHLTDNGNVYADPEIAGISRVANAGLDPRINVFGAAFNSAVPVGDPFFEDVSYIGAFNNDNNWLSGWTALDNCGFFGNLVSATDDPTLSQIDESMKVYPNPASDRVYIEFELERSSQIGVKVFDMQGRQIFGAHANENFGQGTHRLELHTGSLQPGSYIVALIQEGSLMGRRVIVKK